MLFLHRRRFSSWRIVCAVAVFAVCALLLWRGISSISSQAGESQVESLKNAIKRSAIHCYAVEGAYPESLDYIRDNYGVSWDEGKYVVDYEIFGSNMMPSITVIPLKGQGVYG